MTDMNMAGKDYLMRKKEGKISESTKSGCFRPGIQLDEEYIKLMNRESEFRKFLSELGIKLKSLNLVILL